MPNGHNEPGWSRRVQTVPFEDIGRLGVSDDGRTLYLVREASYGQRRNFSETLVASNTRIREPSRPYVDESLSSSLSVLEGLALLSDRSSPFPL